MYSQFGATGVLPLADVTDFYGGTQFAHMLGEPNIGTASAASGDVSNVTNENAPAFSWLAFVAVLVLIRVLYEFVPTG